MENKTQLLYIAILLLFFCALFSLRAAWSDMFPIRDQTRAVEGVFDLRGVDLENAPAYFLDGEWLFYPNQLLSHEDLQADQPDARLIQVPGNWRSTLDEDAHLSYGYGTYRLKVLIDPINQPVTFWMKNIQASSAIYINGVAELPVGNPATSAQEYTPRNISHTATYTATGTTEFDLLIQVSNFDSPFSGGLMRSVRFGSQAAIDYLRLYSVGFQLIMFIFLLLHGLYGLLLYVFNRRERALLYMVWLMLSVAIAVICGHDNVLQTWLPVSYAWAIKIRTIALLWQNYFILLIFRKFANAPARNVWLRAYVTLISCITGLLLIAPAHWVNAFLDLRLFLVVYLIPFAWFIYVVGSMTFRKQGDEDAIFLLLTAAGITSNLSWSIAESSWDVTNVYYPLDIIAAMIGFVTYWFKKYFRNASAKAQLYDQLKRVDKLKDQFLANTSHELRTPLHGVINIAQTVVAHEKDAMAPRSLQDMELLITISRRMSRMLGDLLDVARLQEHRIVLQKESFHVQSIVPSVIAMLKYMAEGRPIQLQSRIPEDLPPVVADEKRLVQILYNLLHNALKYTEEGTITATAEMRDGLVLIHVSDTGVGMDQNTQARVFLPYEQGSYGVSDGRGIGLGLSICKQLVELHGSKLTVRSAPGAGSVFSFSLRVADSSYAASQQLLDPNRQLADYWEGDPITVGDPRPRVDIGDLKQSGGPAMPVLLEGKVNILAVDDDPVNLNVLVGILSTEPYRITAVHSAREVLELLGTNQWDLLIADVMMPQMSGYELTQKVREQFSVSELPVLLLTARSQPADIYTGFSSGANDYVTKPVDALELKYRIRALISMKQSINERLRMEAAYLQAQIHPHFLFNTLNSIMALSDVDTDKMRELGAAFASFLRISFDFINTGELVDLSHELELVEAYLFIEQARFDDRLSVIWEVESASRLMLPPLTIQPLVENAVRHGILSLNQGGTVRIRITRQDGCALVEVQDNGRGMEPQQVQQLLNPVLKEHGGIGVANTNRRLMQLYGQGLSIVSKPGEGTTVSFRIPDRFAVRS